MAESIANWSPYDTQVDASGRFGSGRFASGAFTMLAAGPPRLAGVVGSGSNAKALAAAALAAVSPNFALPIGIVQNLNLSHNRQFSRFWELGSERSYFISGRTQAQASFGRVLYNGPSLLRMMYAFYGGYIAQSLTGGAIAPFGDITDTSTNAHLVEIPPGFENIYLNLASDLFSQPCGLMIYMKDSNEATLGGVYLEETYIPSHSLSVDAQGVVIQEQVSLQPERVVPISFPVSLGTSDYYNNNP